MIDWIIGLFGGAAGTLAKLRDAVADGFNNLILWLYSLFVRWVIGFSRLYTTGRYMKDRLFNAIAAGYDWMIWLLLIKLPAEALQTFQRGLQIAQALLAAVRAELLVMINDLRQWAQMEILQAIDLARSWVQDLRDFVNDARALLDRVANIVFGLLASPRVLADWLAGSIIQAIVRWAEGNAEYIGALILRYATSAIYKFAGILEKVLIDLLF